MAIAGSLTWGESTATVWDGQTITVPVSSDTSDIVIDFSPVAEIVSATNSQIVLRGLQTGTKTIPSGTSWTVSGPGGGQIDMSTENSFSLTVLPDNPKVALESQWADLASMVKALDARVTALENT